MTKSIQSVKPTQYKKKITKLRLINWQYYGDVTIDIKGPISLFTGKTGAGKSTILDALQVILAGSTSNFNSASGSRDRRTLRSYVRGEVKEEGRHYLRPSGAVISYVAAEVYEEKFDRYFVLGTKIDSPSVEADVVKRWFCVDGMMDSITFTVDGRPATDKEFTQNGTPIKTERQAGKAQEAARIRLGRLDSSFPKLLNKAIAYRSMDSLDSFVNNWILQPKDVNLEGLKSAVDNLTELSKILKDIKEKVSRLRDIVKKADSITDAKRRLLGNDMVIAIAEDRDKKDEYKSTQDKLENDKALLKAYESEGRAAKAERDAANRRCSDLKAAQSANEIGNLIERMKDSVRNLEIEKARADNDREEYEKQLAKVKAAAGEACISEEELKGLASVCTDKEAKQKVAQIVAKKISMAEDIVREERARLAEEARKNRERVIELEADARNLERNKPLYDINTKRLLSAINEEFEKLGIKSEARVFADLIDVRDEAWRNAAEAFLGPKRTNIIVDPKYHKTAISVYNRLKREIHSVGIVDIAGIKTGGEPVENSLLEVIEAKTANAEIYARRLLGHVTRCEDVHDLKNYGTSITKDCIRYQGNVTMKINPAVYASPLIGRDSIRVNLERAKKELAEAKSEQARLSASMDENMARLGKLTACNTDTLMAKLFAKEALIAVEEKLKSEKNELQKAQTDASYSDLRKKIDEAERAYVTADNKYSECTANIASKKRDIEEGENREKGLVDEIKRTEAEISKLSALDIELFNESEKTYETRLAREMSQEKTKKRRSDGSETAITPAQAVCNSARLQKQMGEGHINTNVKDLMKDQATYRDGELGLGMEVMPDYRKELEELEQSVKVKYEEDIAKSRVNYETCFREQYLLRIRESIEAAKMDIDKINGALKGVYCGNDSYQYEIKPNPDRAELYEMIMSDVPAGDDKLVTESFNERYHDEMEKLFDILMNTNDDNMAIVEKLMDYRSFLSYELWIITRDGARYRFTNKYGTASGGEKQTPYYITMICAFMKMYENRETVRTIIFDEAFENMDAERAKSVINFMRSQNMQAFLAIPEDQMAGKGELVDDLLMAGRGESAGYVDGFYM